MADIKGIKQWAEDDRPREKALLKGIEHLSNSELLAILIHNGTRNKSAVDLGKEICELGNNDLNDISRLSVADLCKIPGIGNAKAITIVAALELSRRRQAGEIMEVIMRKSLDIATYLQPKLQDYRHEVFAVLFLNRGNRVKHYEVISEGGLTGTMVDVRVILRKALEKDALGIILCHNHPSGNLTPSQADIQLTKNMQAAARLLQIEIIDHLIVSHTGFYSFADQGML